MSKADDSTFASVRNLGHRFPLFLGDPKSCSLRIEAESIFFIYSKVYKVVVLMFCKGKVFFSSKCNFDVLFISLTIVPLGNVIS